MVSGEVTNTKPYKYYKFYKACDMECDVILDIFPLSSYGSVLSVLINYQDPFDISKNMTKLPTWKNDPIWTISLKSGSEITIEGTEPYFFEHHGKNGTK